MRFSFKKNNLILHKKIINAYNNVRIDNDNSHICNAPFKSLLFIPTGEMMVCHYNRGYILGTYPENSINEVWQGKKLDNLRLHIAANDFSLGCSYCFNNLNNKNFNTGGPCSYDDMPATDNQFPALMEFQLSNQCNLECIMCSGEYSSKIRGNRENLPNYISPYDNNFVDQLNIFFPFLRKAYFTGGEPFIIPIYRKIWDNIFKIKPDIEINVSTNASVLDNEIKNIIEKGNFNFTVSIDTLNTENYNKIRKHANLTQTLDNIKYLQEYSHKKNKVFSVKFVVIKQNIKDIPELFHFFNSQNVQLFPKIVDLPFKYSLFSASSEELGKAISQLESINHLTNTDIQKQNVLRCQDMIDKLKRWQSDIIKRNNDDLLYIASKDEIKSLLKKRLINYIENEDSLEKSHKSSLIIELNLIFDKFETGISDHAALKKAYYAFYVQSSQFIISEILRGNHDKLVARFREETR